MSDNIPFEIQIEIIQRLPVKSLFQCRSVSKSWKSLIDNTQFIADYNSCQTRPQRLFIRCKFESNYKNVCFVDDDIFPQNKFATSIPLSVGTPTQLKVVGSSQGLLCLLDINFYGQKAFIWNPAIRKCIPITVPVSDQGAVTILGFGVCPNTNEPMIVKSSDFDVTSSFEVFTLSSGVWRSPRGNVPRKTTMFIHSRITIDRFIYWLTPNRLIVSFDMTSEEFADVILPCSLTNNLFGILSISKLMEPLVVLKYYKEAGNAVCDVWMMEHGVPISFTKLYTVTSPNASIIKVLGFKRNGEVILETKRDYSYEPAVLEVYEPRSKQIMDLGICGHYGSFFMSSYTETLLLLDQRNTSI